MGARGLRRPAAKVPEQEVSCAATADVSAGQCWLAAVSVLARGCACGVGVPAEQRCNLNNSNVWCSCWCVACCSTAAVCPLMFNDTGPCSTSNTGNTQCRSFQNLQSHHAPKRSADVRLNFTVYMSYNDRGYEVACTDKDDCAIIHPVTLAASH